MDLDKIPCYSKVAPRVKSWFNPTTFQPKHLRGIIMGTAITVALGEVIAYKLIKQNIMAGELNMYTTDIMIVSIALLEAFVGPFLAWYGYRNRRRLILLWNVAFILISLTWLAMPTMPNMQESEYCYARNFIFRGLTVTPKAAIRLSMLVLSCIVFVLFKSVVWCHGIAFIDEHASARMGVHFGILVMIRVLPLLAGNKIFADGVVENLSLKVAGLVGGTMFNIVQVFLFIPKTMPPAEDVPTSDRGFFVSLSRVLRNTQALTEAVAIGLLAAALWGFAFNADEIIKVTYHIDPRDSVANNSQVMRYFVVCAISVVYVGVKFSPPILKEFCKYRGIKQATLMSLIAFIFYILITTTEQCERGRVAGLQQNHYNFPNCSESCNCIPKWREFNPVCVLDDVTTYLSPCQAGCSSSETIEGIRVFTNCLCAPNNGRAMTGACSQENCNQSYSQHVMLFIMIILTTVLALHAHGMVLLRLVDPRDKSVTLGVLGSVVALITFVCGHLIFVGINAASCRWFEGARCHLQTQKFPLYISSASASMVLLSIIISISTLVYWKVLDRRRKNKIEEPIGPEEPILVQG